MVRFKYRYCKVHMARYLSGDLADPARRRLARYIDENDDCFREYMRHREFAQKLESNLPTLGRPDPQRLGQLWTALQEELQAPQAQSTWFSASSSRANMHFNYGLVVLAITIALMLPLALGYSPALLSIDFPSRAALCRRPSTGERPVRRGSFRDRGARCKQAVADTAEYAVSAALAVH